MKTHEIMGTMLSLSFVWLVLVPTARASDEAIRCDQTITRQLLSRELDRIRLDFDVFDDEIVRIDVSQKPGQNGFSPVWRLVDAHAVPVAESDCDRGERGSSDCGPLDATRKPYFIEVSEGTGEPGDYVARVQRLTEAVACERTPISCDLALDGRIDVDGDTDLVHIGAVANGARIGIAVAGSNAHWRLLDLQGRAVGATFAPHALCRSSFGVDSANSGPWDCGPLSATGGPYMLEVRGDVGDYQVSLQGLPASARCESRGGESAPLGCDEIRTLEIATRADSDFVPLGFHVANGEILDVSVLQNPATSQTFSPRWRLLRANGTAVADVHCDARAKGYQSCGPLDESGNPYAIHVFDNDMNATGSYRVYAQRLTTPNVCEDAARCAIDDAAETDLVALGFDATDGQFVTVEVRATTGAPTAFTPHWRLIDRHGFPAGLAECDDYRTGSRSCGPLLVSDNPYRIEIQDDDLDATGRYEIRIDGAPVCSTCGNGVLERREECDSGATGSAGSCCRECELTARGTECRSPLGSCDVAETCDGVNALCPTDRVLPASTLCREARGVCDLAEQCSGVGPSCPPDGFAAGAVCRPTVDECDLPETCSGASTLCPVDLIGSPIGTAALKLGKTSVTGRFVFDGTPTALGIDPITQGFGLQVTSSPPGTPGITVAVPAGVVGTSPCGAKDGWKVAKNGLSFTYTNRSGALPSFGCAPGSAGGLRKITIAVKSRRKDPLRSDLAIAISAKAPFTAGLATGAYVVSLDLGDGAGVGPVCPDQHFIATRCTLPAKPKGRLTCAS